jgi:hypothetical protein
VRRLKSHRLILRSLSSSGGKISFFIGWFLDKHVGETLDVELLDELADLRISLDLGIHVPDEPRAVQKRIDAR